MAMSQSFEDWFSQLVSLAADERIYVADADAWREPFEQGISPRSALVDEYPELVEGPTDEPAMGATFDPEAVAAAINIPLSDWPGNCYAVANQMLVAGLLAGRAAYGHYLGVIRPGTLFYGKPIVHHGWIVTTDGRIIDPTRWVFEGVGPYIHQTTLSHEYDEGGNVLLLMRQRPAPVHEENSITVEIPVDARPLCSALLSRKDVQSRLTTAEAHWLATLSLIVLGDQAKALYEALVAMGFAALIPIDNRTKVIE